MRLRRHTPARAGLRPAGRRPDLPRPAGRGAPRGASALPAGRDGPRPLADAVDRRRLVQLAELGLAAWIVFDTLGDDVPGGIVIEEFESSVHGPHPGFAEDFPFCEIAAELTGA